MTICLKNANICDAVRWNQKADVLVEDGMIREIGENLSGDTVLDFSGKTLLPGLFDAHVHMVSGPKPEYYAQALRDWAQSGVLTVRDLGLGNTRPTEDYLAWREERTADPECAEILTAGRAVAAKGGYMHKMGGQENGIGVETPAEAEAAIRGQISLGCDGVKIAMDEDMMDPHTPQYSPETIRAIAETTRELGVWCTAHVQMSKYLRPLVENGIPEMAHTVLDPIPEDLLREMLEKKIPITSTLQPINVPRPPLPQEEIDRMPPKMREMMKKMEAVDTAQQERDAVENIRRFHAGGGMVVMGTDTMRMDTQPGVASVPLRELRLLHEAGLSVREVIASATINAAKACKVEDRLGSIEPGKQANLIAFDGVLDESFDALGRVNFVMNRGVIIKREILA